VDEFLLDLDIGTSSSKAVLARADGTVISTAEQAHKVSLPQPGWVEHDAQAVWWADIQALLARFDKSELASVKGLCVSGLGPVLLPIRAKGEPLRPAILYGVDTRATAEAEELTDHYGAEAVLSVGGSPLTSQALGPKLLWLRRNEPEMWGSTRRFLMASSFAVFRLTSEYVLDHHSASQCDPLYDLGHSCWPTDWAGEVVPGLEFPRLMWPGEVAGTLSAEAASETGVRVATPVAAGTIDSWAEAFGAGVVAAGDTMLSYGTTMFIVYVASKALPDPYLWLTAGVTPQSRTVAAGMATSEALTSWLRIITADPSYEQLLAEAEQASAGADGLVVLPYFAGERTPLFDPSARGAILGLSLRHGRGHPYRALLEATAFGVRHNLKAIERAGGDPQRLVAVGGGTRGGLWAQLVSDVTGRDQDAASPSIGASYGDAHLAGAAADLVPLDARGATKPAPYGPTRRSAGFTTSCTTSTESFTEPRRASPMKACRGPAGRCQSRRAYRRRTGRPCARGTPAR
jgi:xylulokinase